MGPLHEGGPMNRALGLCKGHRSTWGTAWAPTSSRKPRGLPTCGLFCSREGGRASETAPPCLVVRLFLCLGMLSSSVLTAATSASGGRPLSLARWVARASKSPTPTWAQAGTAGGTQSMWHWGVEGGFFCISWLFLLSNRSFLLRQGQEPVSNCGTNYRTSLV